MDLPLSGAGPVATVVIGALFVGLAAVAIGVPLSRHDFTRGWQPAFLVVVFSTLGLALVRIGVQRYRWRRRHPGVDPLLTETGRPADPDSAGARIVRAVVLVITLPGAFFLGAVVVVVATTSRAAQTPGVRIGSVLLAAAAAALVVAVLVADLRALARARRRRRDRGARAHGPGGVGRAD